MRTVLSSMKIYKGKAVLGAWPSPGMTRTVFSIISEFPDALVSWYKTLQQKSAWRKKG